ncbi:DUF4239 domain-containing protein [Pseudoruegeria sp. SK021]|uniref:bestrophin-like domain n=1 Tax=Pseudoruegeria sp. SK021 TaxID=1933035 RepID=UPI000A24014D|nr:DUF4239 domain-containing protein [Pseudoruegeria sp. SK021]OSP54416.1 hypothetical protein BV911_12500 [Pseudoruegeria sp. SK021]
MTDILYDIPQTQLAIWFAVVAVGVTFLGLLLVKPLLRMLVGRSPDLNDTISHSTAMVSLFYGLLIGLLTVAAYQNRERVDQSIRNEAGAVGALYSDLGSYPEPIRSDVKAMLRDYTLYTIYRDWPAHQQGETLNGGANRADAMRQRLASFAPGTVSSEIVHREVMSRFQEFSSFRQQRLNGVTTKIPAVLWYAVMVGAAINIMLLLMLRIRLVPHFVLGTINAFFLGMILFVIVALDNPLRGERSLQPTAFQTLWDRQMIWDEPQS